MNDKRLYGIVPALITPLHADGTLDIDSLERLIESQLDAGVHGIFVAGMTGEGAALDEPELRALVRRSARILRGRVPLCAGVLEAGTRRVIETALTLADDGADILSTTVPYGPPAPTQDEIVRHFEAICRATPLPWMVYGNSGAFANITPGAMARLAAIDGVCAIKDTRPDFEGCLKDIMAVRGTGVTLLCGGEYLVGPGLLFGADGNISGATNLFPRLFVHLYEAAKRGDVKAVRSDAEAIAQIHALTALPGAGWLAVFKYIGSRMGLMQPWSCRPHGTLTDDQKHAIDKALERIRGI